VQIDAGREWRGGQNQVRLLARELARAPDVDQLVVTRAGSPLAGRVAAAGGTVVGVPWGPSIDPRAVWQLRLAVRRFRPHVVHAHDSHALTTTLLARTLAGFRFPVVATRRVDFAIRRTSPWRRADHVFAVSQAVHRMLVAGGVPAARLSVVPDGVDIEEIRQASARSSGVRAALGLAPSAPLAVNLAALVAHKDQDTLVRAAAAARPLQPDLHWVIGGEGPLRDRLTGAIAAAGLGDRVHLVGYVEEADALIREATVLVMSSREEGLGSVVLHALAIGTPVVATRAGGLPDILPPAALVPVGDPEALARKVLESLSRPAVQPFPPRCTAAAMAAAVLARYRALT